MRDFPEVKQSPTGAGVLLRDRTGTVWLVTMDWSGPYPMILCNDKWSIEASKFETAP